MEGKVFSYFGNIFKIQWFINLTKPTLQQIKFKCKLHETWILYSKLACSNVSTVEYRIKILWKIFTLIIVFF